MMRIATLSEIKALARAAYNDLWDGAKANGRDVKIYEHWTAGHYDQLFDDYHINIDGDGRVYISTENFADVKAATYMRNTGSIAVTLCAAYNSFLGQYANLGPEPPTDLQVNAMAQVTCVLADALDLSIDLQHVLTHAEAADNKDGIYACDPYGPDHDCERWDLYVTHENDRPYTGGDIIRGNANYYRAQDILANI